MAAESRHSLYLGLLLAAALGGWALVRDRPPRRDVIPDRSPPRSVEPNDGMPQKIEPAAGPRLEAPRGGPARLPCLAARSVVHHVRSELAAAPRTPDAEELAELWLGWFDPHGLWSAAPDSPLRALVRERARGLISEIEMAPRAASRCDAAQDLGVATHAWVAELRAVFEEERANASALPTDSAFELASSPIFEDDPVTRPARELAAELGRRIGAVSGTLPELGSIAQKSLDRLLPELTVDDWAEAALAAALRAYVPAVDPHGQWAPADEETSLYLGDPALDPGPLLWGEMMRTTFGVRVTSDPAPPLMVDDLVLAIDGVATPGLSMEQIEQLARVGPSQDAGTSRVTMLRAGMERAVELDVFVSEEPEGALNALPTERVRFAGGEVLVVRMPEIADGSGEDLGHVLRDANSSNVPSALLLDLRGNGGGSTDGALAVIGAFLPGAASFPLMYRGALREVLSAPAQARAASWSGPVGVLVDGYTASAAEMVAGALQAYARGIVIGERTFGKGCIQEYFDHDSGGGVLRLTTLEFVLPDGAQVQRSGLQPGIVLALGSPSEREADLSGALLGRRGRDVRDQRVMAAVAHDAQKQAWPAHAGRVGPCADKVVCQALSMLGQRAAGVAARAKNRAISRARVRFAD